MLFNASGQRLRRAIGFLPEYRVVRDEKPEVDLVSDHSLDLEEDFDEEDQDEEQEDAGL